MTEERMAKGEHEKINRPAQTGYNISLDPQDCGEKVTWVTVRFGTKQGIDIDGKNIYKWDLSVGPIEFQSKTKKTVLAVSADQLPAAADSCYYQLLCEIKQEPHESSPPDEPETLITEATLLTSANMYS